MLVIREEQIEALIWGKVDTFKTNLVLDLQQKFNPIASTLETRERVDLLIEKGRGYGLEQAADLRFFCYLFVALEDRWDYLWGWMEPILEDSTINGQMKLEIIYENLEEGEGYHPFLEKVGLR